MKIVVKCQNCKKEHNSSIKYCENCNKILNPENFEVKNE